MSTPAARSTRTVAGIERALDVLSLFSATDAASLGVTEIAQELGLSKAVVHRILASFRSKGFIELDETTRRYSIGPKVLFLGLTYLERMDLHRVAREAMASLAAQTRETVTLSIRSGRTRVDVDQVLPPRDVRVQVALGVSHPLHAGASGMAFLAFLPAHEQDDYLDAPLEATASAVDARRLRADLARIRQVGYADSVGETVDGGGAVAAPLRGLDGQPVAVISVHGPVERLRAQAGDTARLLLETTRSASVKLGHRGAAPEVS